MVAVVALSMVLSSATLVSAHPVEDHDHASAEQQGLGDYGPSGPIARDDLPVGWQTKATDEALQLAASPELAEARAGWDSELDFVGHLNYQLRFRAHADYLSTDPAHLGALLVDLPQNIGIEVLGLYMTADEADEFERRQALGERIEDVVAAIGEAEPVAEGEELQFGPNYAGVWMDQKDGGAIVVAVVEPALVDQQHLEQLVGGKEHLRVIDVEYSWHEVNAYRDALADEIIKRGIQAHLPIHSTSQGRLIEVIVEDAGEITKDILDVAPDDLVTVTEAPLGGEMGTPTSTHSEAEQQPGLQIEFDPGTWCNWGHNGHTSSYNYIVTAGHCGGTDYDDYNNWASYLEIHQNDSFHLTPGTQWVYSRNTDGWDMFRMSSPQADSNCYHADTSCNRNMSWRTLHNSWEEGIDYVCASLGTTNDYNCGVVQEWDYVSTMAGCEGSRWVRFDIDTQPGDSGAGLMYPVAAPDSTVDGIFACATTTFSFGNTAYDVKNRLAFDYNCSRSVVTGRSASSWGACPTWDR
jgi:hypothetical protein